MELNEAIPCPWCPRRFLSERAAVPHIRDIHPEHAERLTALQLPELRAVMLKEHAARLKARKAVKHGSK